jgi:hypothetical protein
MKLMELNSIFKIYESLGHSMQQLVYPDSSIQSMFKYIRHTPCGLDSSSVEWEIATEAAHTARLQLICSHIHID